MQTPETNLQIPIQETAVKVLHAAALTVQLFFMASLDAEAQEALPFS